MIFNVTGGKKWDWPVFEITGSKITHALAGNEITLPVEIDGTPVNQMLIVKPTGSDAINSDISQFLLKYYKRVVIPSYFTRGSFEDGAFDYGLMRIEEIENNASKDGNNAQKVQFWNVCPLRKYKSSYDGAVIMVVDPSNHDGEGPFEIDLPNATGTLNLSHHNSYGTRYGRELLVNAPNVSALVKPSGFNDGTEFIYGTYHIESATYMEGWATVCVRGHNAFYLDSIESLGEMFFDGSFAGTTDMYLGPHLNTINGTASNSFKSAITAGKLTIHISPGINTTKTTLDAAGISYIQDYEPIG